MRMQTKAVLVLSTLCLVPLVLLGVIAYSFGRAALLGPVDHPLVHFGATLIGATAALAACTVVAVFIVARWMAKPVATLAPAIQRHDNEAIRQYAAELARSNAELQQFANIASHDLQEPLRMVSGYLQLLARRYHGRLDGDAEEFIAYAIDGINRMQRLIDDLLAYSRVENRRKPIEPVDLASSLTHALANLQIAIDEQRATVTHDPLPMVVADTSQLAQVFQNLIGNALKFHGTEPPRVHVGATPSGDDWVITVADNGIGLEPRYAERVFTLFQRLHTSAEYPGTGIGLAICKKIIERHGGRIWVESQLGRGAAFHFTLRAASVEAESASPRGSRHGAA